METAGDQHRNFGKHKMFWELGGIGEVEYKFLKKVGLGEVEHVREERGDILFVEEEVENTTLLKLGFEKLSPAKQHMFFRYITSRN